jgi:thiol:disulfide interchange protein DsbD
MKLASILPAIAGAFMFVSWVQLPPVEASQEPAAGEPAAAHIVWQASEAAGREQAAVQGKPVIIDFGASWCKACKELEEHTFPNARVRREGARFVAIKVDATDDEAPEVLALQAKYKVVGLPTVIVLDSTGKEAVRFTEFVPPERFAEALAPVK